MGLTPYLTRLVNKFVKINIVLLRNFVISKNYSDLVLYFVYPITGDCFMKNKNFLSKATKTAFIALVLSSSLMLGGNANAVARWWVNVCVNNQSSVPDYQYASTMKLSLTTYDANNMPFNSFDGSANKVNCYSGYANTYIKDGNSGDYKNWPLNGETKVILTVYSPMNKSNVRCSAKTPMVLFHVVKNYTNGNTDGSVDFQPPGAGNIKLTIQGDYIRPTCSIDASGM